MSRSLMRWVSRINSGCVRARRGKSLTLDPVDLRPGLVAVAHINETGGGERWPREVVVAVQMKAAESRVWR